jgi:hypothetical protein
MAILMLLQSGTENTPQLRWFFASIFIIGTLSMTLLQLLKDMLPLRLWFQRAWIKRWIAEQMTSAPPPFGGTASYVEDDLLGLAASKRREAVYRLPVEQLCGQLNAALRAALENPDRHRALISAFANAADPEDLRIFLDPPKSLRIPGDAPPGAREKLESYVEARNRITHQVERSIDSLQITLGGKWKFWLQSASLILSLAFVFLGIGMYWQTDWSRRGVFDRIAIGLFAGYVAPVVRDILGRLQQGGR